MIKNRPVISSKVLAKNLILHSVITIIQKRCAAFCEIYPILSPLKCNILILSLSLSSIKHGVLSVDGVWTY